MNPIKRNLIWLLFAQAATWVVSISLLLIGPRILGDKVFGQLSLVIAYVGFFDLLASMGTNTFLIKMIARDHDNVSRLVMNAVFMKLVLAFTASSVALVLAMSLHMSRTVVILMVAYCLGMTINAVGTTIGAALTGLQLMSRLARWNIIQAYVGGLGSIAVLLAHGSVITYAFVFNLASLVPIPANFRQLRPHLDDLWTIDFGRWKEIFRGGLPFFVLAALLVAYGTIDIPLLQAYTGSAEVGWYSVAYRWVSVPAFFAASIGTAFFPAMSAHGAEVNPEFVSLANRAARIAVLLATPAAVGIALISAPFLQVLYGSEFHQSVPLLRILAIHIPIVSLDIILGSVATACDRQKQWVVVSVIATISNPLLNLFAIPFTQHHYGNGAIGAAGVTVFTEVILMVGGLVLRPKGVLGRSTVGMLARVALASATMAPVVIALRSTPLPLQVVAGAVAYAVASMLLRTVTVHEVTDLVAGVRRRRSHGTAIGSTSTEPLDPVVSLIGAPLGVPEPPFRPRLNSGSQPLRDPNFSSLTPDREHASCHEEPTAARELRR